MHRKCLIWSYENTRKLIINFICLKVGGGGKEFIYDELNITFGGGEGGEGGARP